MSDVFSAYDRGGSFLLGQTPDTETPFIANKFTSPAGVNQLITPTERGKWFVWARNNDMTIKTDENNGLLGQAGCCCNT
jgi:hypothetical protein